MGSIPVRVIQKKKDTQSSVLFLLFHPYGLRTHLQNILFWIGFALYALPFRVGTLQGWASSRTNFRLLLLYENLLTLLGGWVRIFDQDRCLRRGSPKRSMSFGGSRIASMRSGENSSRSEPSRTGLWHLE